MSKQSIRVTIGRAVQLTSPGVLGRKFDFSPGHTFLTREWFYPGEPYKKEGLAGRPSDAWSFATNTTTDLPLFFAGADVKEVVIPEDPEIIRIFDRTPFQVTVKSS